MITPFRNALANAKLTILMLSGVLFLSFLVNVFCIEKLARVPKQLSIWIKPPIPASGLKATPDHIDKENVYAFTSYVWQAINYWPNDAQRDFMDNIKRFTPYITFSFKNTLLNMGKHLDDHNQLYGRSRVMFSATGERYDPEWVKYVGHGTWLVKLDVRILTKINDSKKQGFVGSSINSDVVKRYVFRVIAYGASQSKNPWGLAIDGFAIKPKVVSYLDDSPESSNEAN